MTTSFFFLQLALLTVRDLESSTEGKLEIMI